MPLLATHRLTVTIAGRTVCRELDLAIEAGQRWVVLGRNGVGKTTLLLTLAGLRPPAAGSVTVDDRTLADLSRRQTARRLGILLQDHGDPFPATVFETALSGRHPHLGPWAWEGAQDHARARAALAAVGLEELAQREVGTLSGGERRRLGIATLLTQDPAIHLLDEPTNHLDLHHQVEVLELLADRCRNGARALCMVLHDLNLAARFADHVLLLFGDGQVRHGPRDEVLDRAVLERLYGHPLTAIPAPHGTAWLPG